MRGIEKCIGQERKKEREGEGRKDRGGEAGKEKKQEKTEVPGEVCLCVRVE